MKKKVFIGMTDIASVISEFKDGFKEIGIDTLTVSQNVGSNLHQLNTDVVIPIGNYISNKILHRLLPNKLKHHIEKDHNYIKQKILQKALKECDVFIFIWNSFYPDWKDLEIIKSHGKKIVFLAMGSEVRMKSAYEQEMNNYNISSYFDFLDLNNYDFESRLINTRMTEKYADLIFNLPNQAQLSLRPYHHLFIPINTNFISENNSQNEIPIIAHAPSVRGVKGTEIILKIINELKNEGISFYFQLIENIPHLEALKMYENVDIVIGELFIPSGGKLDREILAAGKISMSCMPKNYLDFIPDDCPIIDINPDNLLDRLKELIIDFPKRKKIARLGRNYVEKYHKTSRVAKNIMDLLEVSEMKKEFDYYPSFFREDFKPSKNEIDVFNKWNNTVKDCDWYKKYVSSGERDGLFF